jgi:hypothetical protein
MAAAADKTADGKTAEGKGARGKPPAARFSEAAASAKAVTEPGGPATSADEDRAALRARLSIPPGETAEERAARGPGEDLRPPRVRAADEGLAPRTQAQIAAVMDPQEWACRSQEHSWPQLVPGADEIPAGMRVSAAGQGNVLFEEDCLHDCGRFRETLTQQGFIVIWRRYGTRPGYRHTVVHRDETMTKGAMREYTLGSNSKLITRAVKADTAARKAREREARAAAKAAAS